MQHEFISNYVAAPQVIEYKDDSSVGEDDLFGDKDKVIFEGVLYKFKPGLSSNF